MNYIDFILCIPLVWGAYKGFSKGLIIEMASLAALVLGIWGGVKFSDRASQFLATTFHWETEYMPVISFAVTFLIIVISIYALGKLLERVINIVSLKLVNKVAGCVFGLAKVGLILSVLITILESVDQRSNFLPATMKQNSLLYEPVSGIAPTVLPAVKNSKLFKDSESELPNQLTQHSPNSR